MFSKRPNSRQATRKAAPAQGVNFAQSRVPPNSRTFINDNAPLNLDAQDGLLQADGTVRIPPSKIKLLTKFTIATLSSLGLSVSIYILIPSIPTYLSANLIPAISNLQSPLPTKNNFRSNSPSKNTPIRAESDIQAKLQNVAYSIIQNDDWSAKKLRNFKFLWIGLNQKQQAITKDTIWFQMFERALTVETNIALKSLTDDKEAYSAQMRALLALALNLNTLKPRHAEASLKNEKKPKKDSSRRSRNINKKMASKSTASVRAPIKVDRTRTKTSTRATQQDSSIKKQPVNLRPSYAELRDITVQFVGAYEAGNLNKFTSLFANNAVSNKQRGIRGIKRQYAQVFSSTLERQMIIHDLKWSYKKNIAIGKGTLELAVISKDDPNVITRKGRVQLVAEKQNNKVVIKRFYQLTE